MTQSHKLHLEQIGDYLLFVQVGIEDPILSNSNSNIIFLSFSLFDFIEELKSNSTYFYSIIKNLLLRNNSTRNNIFLLEYGGSWHVVIELFKPFFECIWLELFFKISWLILNKSAYFGCVTFFYVWFGLFFTQLI